ncbi:MAG: glutathione peroxidase [Croceivirga sp.]
MLNGLSKKAFRTTSESVEERLSSFYDITINQLNGTTLVLSDFQGKYILIVNVASKCGFTPQYRELEQLYQKHKEELIIIGVPCNQFGSQEPGTPSEIESFCERNYGVNFIITEKVNVKGEKQHPLYQWLTRKQSNGSSNSVVRWNFQKYLIDKEGRLIDFFYSITSPSSRKITKYLTTK